MKVEQTLLFTNKSGDYIQVKAVGVSVPPWLMHRLQGIVVNKRPETLPSGDGSKLADGTAVQ